MKKFMTGFGMMVLAVLMITGNAMAISLGNSYDRPAYDLQTLLDDTVGEGVLDAEKDQTGQGVWMESEDGDVDTYLINMVRGDSGRLGIYSAETGDEYYLTASGNDKDADWTSSFSVDDNGQIKINGTWQDAYFGYAFGFFWENTSNALKSYTQSGKNISGYGPDQNVLALSYHLASGVSSKIYDQGHTETKIATGDDWIVAFEDRLNLDGDFNDAVFYVEDIKATAATPEPSTSLLLGIGLICCAVVYRRKRSCEE
ncbi:hypothetical protein DENIS_0293 [Desulfonema ishimotonii]|uniref:Ice-binding protein C-terminal domain-containing protein n=1 Tax=Desulfonema ishimotonii TaxID=45657 RepID=A0A401FQX1_9BACT|nr:PEP-CTERM sorting domain-containing protein [Desulfonema ishimotonii]GBC59354.1 hypothetical protein DENIS_0293 [Desulfonema ishimotonii]